MPSFFEALQMNPLLLAAFLAGLAASVVSGIIGSYVVVKRIVFIGGSISHAVSAELDFAFGWKGQKVFPGRHPLWGPCSSHPSAWIIGWIHLNYRQREDSAIAAIWSIGMAVGILYRFLRHPALMWS